MVQLMLLDKDSNLDVQTLLIATKIYHVLTLNDQMLHTLNCDESLGWDLIVQFQVIVYLRLILSEYRNVQKDIVGIS